MAEEDRVILDSSSFKALASETRVLILKELDKKRSTASEIAKALGISAQSASEHLENMRVAGLVDRVESGRKWVYFQLTEKGKAVLHPENKKFWIFLSIVFLAIASVSLLTLQGGLSAVGGMGPSSFYQETAPVLDNAPEGSVLGAAFPATSLPPLAGAESKDLQISANGSNATNSS